MAQSTHTKLKLGTFNVENLFLRYNFGKVQKTSFEQETPPDLFREDLTIADAPIVKKALGLDLESFQLVAGPQRTNTLKVISENNPDVLAVQEVENLEALKQFNRGLLSKKYEYALLIDANDPRKIDVGILSRFPIVHARSYQFDRDPEGALVFSRDCLEIDVLLPTQKTMTLFINHFKSKIGGGEEKRLRQAKRVAEIVRSRFKDHLDQSLYAVLGDLNAAPSEKELRPLLEMTGIDNVIQTRLPHEERWTHYFPPGHKAEQLDYLILSPELSRKNSKTIPYIERRGLGDYVKIYTGPRFPGVGKEGTEASDHCAVFMDLLV